MKNVEPKNVRHKMLRTPQPKVKNGSVGCPAAFGIHMIHNELFPRTCYKNAARLPKKNNKNAPGQSLGNNVLGRATLL